MLPKCRRRAIILELKRHFEHIGKDLEGSALIEIGKQFMRFQVFFKSAEIARQRTADADQPVATDAMARPHVVNGGARRLRHTGG